MAEERLTLKAEEYRCEPCSLRQGTAVRELVRMVPRAVVLFGKLVGDEYYCCPICFEPKFEVKGRKAVKHGQLGKVAGSAPGGRDNPGPKAGPTLVT